MCAAWAALLSTGGCARLPPNLNSLSGKRLLVTLTFRDAIEPTFFYFFVINNSNNPNAPGPVPVVAPPYGNGFAAGSSPGSSGFTDFVEYNEFQPQSQGGYELYHVIGNSNSQNFKPEGGPISFMPPNPNDPTTANQLQFELDIAQLIVDANGNPLADQSQVVNMARAIRYLQVNVIATDAVPTAAIVQPKAVDSLGDTLTSAGQSNYLTLDLSQIGTIANGDPRVPNSTEPTQNDVFVYPPGSDQQWPSLDIVNWSIDVIDASR